MKKVLTRLLVIVLVAAIFIPIITYGNGAAGAFFTVDKMEVAPEDTVTMTIDLSKIDYEEFKFTLKSNVNLNTVTTDNALDTNLSGNILSISAIKSEISMQKIDLNYNVPSDLQIGTTITLTGRIEPVETEQTVVVEDTSAPVEEVIPEESTTAEEEIITENTATETEESQEEAVNNTDTPQPDANNEPTPEIKQESEVIQTNSEPQEVTITITVSEKSDAQDELENEKEKMKDGQMDKQQMDKNMMDKDMMNDKESTEKMSQTSEKTVSSTSVAASTVTYNGDSNNYLSSLSVDGYDIMPTFSKTSNTYFVNVSNDVTSVSIDADAEDSDAKVSIYGNTNLQVGENKILVSVTAENGDVKTYRIYVIKGGENEE